MRNALERYLGFQMTQESFPGLGAFQPKWELARKLHRCVYTIGAMEKASNQSDQTAGAARILLLLLQCFTIVIVAEILIYTLFT